LALDGWSVVATFGDQISAQALIGLLVSEKVPCHYVSNAAVPGLGTEFAVLVPTPLLHRAQWVREQARVPEAELDELASRKTPDTPS
jgi:hypothetical protein